MRSTYTYSTITVKRDDWYPSVYSNPSYIMYTAFDPDVAPERANKILGLS